MILIRFIPVPKKLFPSHLINNKSKQNNTNIQKNSIQIWKYRYKENELKYITENSTSKFLSRILFQPLKNMDP